MRQFLALCFILLLGCVSQAKYNVPALTGPVMDEANAIDNYVEMEIDQLLRDFDKRDMAQVQVYVTPSLQGLTIEEAAIDIVEAWKLGSKGRDNGLLFLIAPNERKVRIEVGRGLEGIMPDVYTKRINEDLVVPFFRAGQLSEGILEGVKAILKVLDGEELKALAKPEKRSSGKKDLPFWAILLIWIFLMVIGRFGRGGRGGRGGGWYYGGGGGFGGGGFGSGGGSWSGGGGGFSGGGSSSSW